MRLHRNPVLVLLSGALILSSLVGCSAPLNASSSSATAMSALGKKKPKADEKPYVRSFVMVSGTVTELQEDDLKGLKHQHFLIKTVEAANNTKIYRIAHNIDLAPYIPVKVGDRVDIKAVYVSSTPYDVLHWTHHAPDGTEGGYIKLAQKVYQ